MERGLSSVSLTDNFPINEEKPSGLPAQCKGNTSGEDKAHNGVCKRKLKSCHWPMTTLCLMSKSEPHAGGKKQGVL